MQPSKHELRRIRESFDYDAVTGIITWKLTCKFLRRIKPGAIAGTISNGYIHIKIGPRRWYAHAIAYFLVKGRWPTKEIDHEDRNGLNNKWTNLRPATSSQQKANCKIRKDNTSGVRGIAMDCLRNQWQVYICFEKRRINLGRFAVKDLDKAIAARKAGELKYFGEYAPK